MAKFSELLIEYLELRDECQDPECSEYEPIYDRGARQDRMRYLLQEMDSLFQKDPS